MELYLELEFSLITVYFIYEFVWENMGRIEKSKVIGLLSLAKEKD